MWMVGLHVPRLFCFTIYRQAVGVFSACGNQERKVVVDRTAEQGRTPAWIESSHRRIHPFIHPSIQSASQTFTYVCSYNLQYMSQNSCNNFRSSSFITRSQYNIHFAQMSCNPHGGEPTCPFPSLSRFASQLSSNLPTSLKLTGFVKKISIPTLAASC